jgi:phage-related protein
MAVTSAIGDFLSSIGELIASFFNTLYSLITTIVSAITNIITGFFDLIVNTVGSIFNIAGETAKFFLGKYLHHIVDYWGLMKLLGNALILIVIGGAVMAFLQYQRSQGKTVAVGNKKLN